MRRVAGTLVGKSVAAAVRARGKSGGQAAPGLVVEKLIPGYLPAMLRQLPEGVVIITGTNGKTTTTKMVVQLLQANGKRVLTNATGSNLTRGIISSVSQQASTFGRLPFDLAVFELDEAYAKRFTAVVKPNWVLALNASRDQLDRFGEVDTIACLIAATMGAATDGVITNADDKRLSKLALNCRASVRYFGIAPELLRFFPRDDELVSVREHAAPTLIATNVPLSVELTAFTDNQATYRLDGQSLTARLQLTGQHNFQNAAAALSLLQALAPDVPAPTLIEQLKHVTAAFGRGQIFTLKNGSTIQLTLVKNPASFGQGLASYAVPGSRLMFAINDNLADSRDMSWLWDVDFRILSDRPGSVATGSRAADMALRLKYDDVTIEEIQPNLDMALRHFCSTTETKVVFASYTAMLKLYDLLNRQAGKQL